MDRRSAITSMIALAVAPALIKIEMLMPVKSISFLSAFDIEFLRKLKNDPGIKKIVPLSGIQILSAIQDEFNVQRSLIIKKELKYGTIHR